MIKTSQDIIKELQSIKTFIGFKPEIATSRIDDLIKELREDQNE